MAKQLVLDANILMRAVLGTRVVTIIRDYATDVDLLTVDEAFGDVATYLPQVLEKRSADEAEIQAALSKLESLRHFIQTIPNALFESLEPLARERLKGRDEDDWPYVALALVAVGSQQRVHAWTQGPPQRQMLHDSCESLVECGLAKHGSPPWVCGLFGSPQYAARREV